MSPTDLLFELQKRGSNHTNYEPEEFVDAVQEESGLEEHEQIRKVFRSLDNGRFYAMLDEAHNVFGHLDGTNREPFADQHPNLMRWLRAYGYVEEMARFEDYQPEDDNE